jgi:peptidoglycan/LPS O-acetylase OafA/YrhL
MKSLQLHIQFLRAVSVLLVFFYHLKLEEFKFGYVGVDIFFVISGYVITSRLYQELINKKKINFLEFYIRRIKRIFPVLFFILSIILVFIIFFQPLDLFLGNLAVYFFTIFGVSNLYYLFSKKDYFDNVFEDVYGHTWSLGVEEQFYIIFPLFLFFLYKILRKNNFQVYLISILIIFGILLTFKFSENLQLIFYSPIFRFWEFLLGCLSYKLATIFKKKNNLISVVSLFLLIFFILNKFYLNNFNAILISTIFSSIFLFFYETNDKFKFIFENSFFVLMGNISYSFYLWHLPIIYFYDLYIVENFLRIPFIFLLTFSFSFLTFNFIEKKFRYKKFNFHFTKNASITFLTIFILLISYFFYISFQKSYESNVKKSFKSLIHKVNYLENYHDYSNRTVFYKFSLNSNEIYRFCSKESAEFELNKFNLRKECLKEGTSNNRIFFIEGNSHTANYIPLFNKTKFAPGDSIYYEHSSKILDFNTIKKIHNLENIYNEVVYVTNIENYNFNNLALIDNSLNKKIKILILSTVPNLNKNINPLKCLIKKIDCKYSIDDDFDKRNLKNYFFKIENFIELDSYNRFLFYNSYEVMCPSDLCYAYNLKEDKLTHRDISHLTIEGSIFLEESFLNFYKENF